MGKVYTRQGSRNWLYRTYAAYGGQLGPENFCLALYLLYDRQIRGSLSQEEFFHVINDIPTITALSEARDAISSNGSGISKFDVYGNMIYSNLLSVKRMSHDEMAAETKRILRLLGRK